MSDGGGGGAPVALAPAAGEKRRATSAPGADVSSSSSEDEGFGPMPAEEEVPRPDPAQSSAGAAAAAVTRKKANKRARVLSHEQLFVDRLPCADMYETSYMHRDTVTHVVSTCTDFFITASCDGHVKFWKKEAEGPGVVFVKHFRAHLGPITGLAASADGLFLSTTSAHDRSLKLFDVINFDMTTMIKLDYVPSVCCWVHKPGAASGLVACGEQESGTIRVYRAGDEAEAASALTATIEVHTAPVVAMCYNARHDVVLSADESGMLEYWAGATGDWDWPRGLHFEYKTDTDLYALAQVKARPLHLAISNSDNSDGCGPLFAVGASDRRVRIFGFLDGKLQRVYDESIPYYTERQHATALLPAMEFGRRVAAERELEKSGALQHERICFDESGHFILYPCLIGVKVVNLVTNKCVRIIGRGENLRVLACCLYQGRPRRSGAAAPTLRSVASNNPALQERDNDNDPLILCAADKKSRFYVFSRREPEEDTAETGRDVFNEKPSREEMMAVTAYVGNGRREGGRGTMVGSYLLWCFVFVCLFLLSFFLS